MCLLQGFFDQQLDLKNPLNEGGGATETNLTVWRTSAIFPWSLQPQSQQSSDKFDKIKILV